MEEPKKMSARIYIPYNLRAESGLFHTGITPTQIKGGAIIGIIGLVISLILRFTIGGAVFWIGVFATAALVYFVNVRYDNSPSVMELAGFMLKFAREKQKYKYVYRQFQREDGKLVGGGFLPTYIPMPPQEPKPSK